MAATYRPAVIAEALAVEFRVDGDDCPLAAASRRAGVEVAARPPQLRTDGNALLRFSAPRGDALAAALDGDDRVRYLHRSRGPERDEFRCLSLDPCLVHDLTDRGLITERLRYRDGAERYAGAVVGREVLRAVLSAAGEAGGVSLERVHPLGPEPADPAERWSVTPAQAEALRAALAAGYFGVPKGATAAEVAADLGISKTAFLERLRRGQADLLRDALGPVDDG